MKTNAILLCLSVWMSVNLQAQKKEKQAILLTVDDTPVTTTEFKRVYQKNLDLVKEESQKDVDEYLDLFINYKLKIREAYELNLDEKESYKQELATYRKQLASGYLTDSEVTEQLLKEAYDRLQEVVHASHILILVDEDATPKDTLQAFTKIQEARGKIVAGEDFEKVAKEYSQDPSAENNGGDLGWFSAFRMVYPFEDAAFSTPVGDVSEPFRTRFGYHILKVHDKKPASGEISAAHIMIAVTPETSETTAETKIQDIYKKLKQGGDFAALAKEFSEDSYSAQNGGELRTFSRGDLNAPKFEDAAFLLDAPGDITEPVRSAYGWHIIKLIEKHPVPTFEESKTELTEKIKKDSRSQLITEAFIERLKNKYSITENREVIDYFANNIQKDTTLDNFNLVKDSDENKIVFKIEDSTYTYADFEKQLKSSFAGAIISNPESTVQTAYDEFEEKQLLEYYEANLEKDNKDFAAVLSEYRDGLLLFDLMENKVWNAAKTDTVGLKKYHETHQDKYQWEKRYKVIKASVEDKAIGEKVKEMLQEGKHPDAIRDALNTEDSVAVLLADETLLASNPLFAENSSYKKDDVITKSEGDTYTVYKIEDILPAGAKALDETKGKVINDYQKELEEKWLAKLKDTYSVKVNKKVLKKLRKELNTK